MILCNNCGANLDSEKTFCGECGARNPAFPEPSPAPPAPPAPKPSPDGKFLLVLVGLAACFVVGALVATAILLSTRPDNAQNNTNYLYANANTGYNSNSYTNTNVSLANTSNTSVSNVNSYPNVNSYANANTNMNTGYGNMNANSNRRASVPPFENAEYKVLKNIYLSGGDVSSLSASQLRLLRNTVFAKYGRVFLKDADLQVYFDTKSWYVRNESYTKSTDYVELTAADEANLDVIKAAEASRMSQ